MRRGTLEKLGEEQWVRLWDDTSEAMEVRLVPDQMPEISTAQFTGSYSDSVVRQMCEDGGAFTGFRGYFEDDGETPRKNTYEERVWLYSKPGIRTRINQLLVELNAEIAQGEDSGGSD